MQVIFFGAGASAPACYPLASDLLPAIEKMVKVERRFANLEFAWKVWKEYRDKARGPIKAFLTSPNPEVVFSFLDLYDIAQDAEFPCEDGERQARGEASSSAREQTAWRCSPRPSAPPLM